MALHLKMVEGPLTLRHSNFRNVVGREARWFPQSYPIRLSWLVLNITVGQIEIESIASIYLFFYFFWLIKSRLSQSAIWA